MFCPQCGLENKSDAKFCQECGARIKPAPKQLTSPKNGKWVNIIIISIIALAFLWYILILLGGAHIPGFGKPEIHIGDKQGIIILGTINIQFQIYNSGDASANNVYAIVQVINPDSGKILSSKKVFVGNLAPGESKSITSSIKGDFPSSSKFTIIPQYE